MQKRKKDDFEKWLDKELQDNNFKKGYEQKLIQLRIAEQIIQSRKAQQLTQMELAKRAGTSQTAIARMEKASYTGYSFKTLQKVADALNCYINIAIIPVSPMVQQETRLHN